MNKIICISFGFLMLFGCTCDHSEEDYLTEDFWNDSVWKPVEVKLTCESGSEEIIYLSDCEQTSQLVFHQDGTLRETIVGFYDGRSDFCEQISIREGLWEWRSYDRMMIRYGSWSHVYMTYGNDDLYIKFSNAVIYVNDFYECDQQTATYYEIKYIKL